MSVYTSVSNIHTQQGIVNNITANGSGFAVTPNDENIFISVRTMEQTRLNIGDKIKAFCTDNHADPETQHLAARWRALRVVIEERFGEAVGLEPEPKPVAKPIVAPKPAPRLLSTERVCEEVDLLLAKGRPWNAKSLVLEIEDMFPIQRTVTGMEATIKTYLDTQFADRKLVKAILVAGDAPTTAVGVYYATTVEVLEEHLSTAIED